MLKQLSISAGNLLNKGTSETLRNEITTKKVSIHLPKHLKPANDSQFGHYLAGLIDGDGHFSSKQQLIIAFHSLDIQLAYYIKKQIGYGIVRKIKDKNAILFIIANSKGIERVITLINNKFRTTSKYNQIINNIFAHPRFKEFSKTITLGLNSNNNLNNHWLAGFSDADASFQIKILNRDKKIEVRLNYQIDQKKEYLLSLIKDNLGGNIGYRKSQDTYYYGSTSFGSAKKVINYFDNYHLLSSKYISYLK